MITNSYSFGARYSLGNVKDTQQAVFLSRQLSLLPKRRTHALRNGPLCFIPSICYRAARQPHPCYWYTSSDASHCTFNHCIPFSAVALLPHAYVCTYTHTATIYWTSGCVAQCPRDKKQGKKRRNNFRNKSPFMTHSSQTDQHSARSASLASEIASTWSHQPRQPTAERTGQIPGRDGSIHDKVGDATHRGNAALRLNPAGSKGGSTLSTGSPATHLA